MSLKVKLISAFVAIILIIGYVVYTQYTINSLKRNNLQLTESLNSTLASNSVYEDIIKSYESAIRDKEAILEETQNQLQSISEQLKGLQDEQSKTYLSTRTPASVEQLLKSTDYYYKTNSSKSSSIVSGIK